MIERASISTVEFLGHGGFTLGRAVRVIAAPPGCRSASERLC